MMDAAARGPNVHAAMEFLLYAGAMLTLSFIVWGLLPALAVGGIVLIAYLVLWNAWALFRPIVAPVAAVAFLALNYAIRVGILVGMGWAVCCWLLG